MQNERKTSNRPGRPPVGKTLTPTMVAQAAARLIDADGIEAFSMRRLGQVLGVEAMALYNHFKDKEAILDAVASVTLAGIPAPPDRGMWRNRIKTLCREVRKLAHEHPNLFRVAMTRRTVPTAAMPMLEGILAAFAEAGLSAEMQASAYHLCYLYVRAFCLWEIEQFRSLPGGATPQIPPVNGDYHRVAEAKQWIFTPNLDREFESGLDTILRGLLARNGR